jgi:hypothetical protein
MRGRTFKKSMTSSDLTMTLNSDAIAAGDNTLTTSATTGSIIDKGAFVLAKGTTKSVAKAQSSDGSNVASSADTSADVSGADFFFTHTRTSSKTYEAGDQTTKTAISSTFAFAIDIKGFDFPKGPIEIRTAAAHHRSFDVGGGKGFDVSGTKDFDKGGAKGFDVGGAKGFDKGALTGNVSKSSVAATATGENSSIGANTSLLATDTVSTATNSTTIAAGASNDSNVSASLVDATAVGEDTSAAIEELLLATDTFSFVNNSSTAASDETVDGNVATYEGTAQAVGDNTFVGVDTSVLAAQPLSTVTSSAVAAVDDGFNLG